MAFTFLSRFSIRPDKETEFIKLARQMMEISRDEPATLAYCFYRLEEPGMFAVYESFTTQAGDVAHQENPLNVPLIKAMVACMDGSYSREMLYDLEDKNVEKGEMT